jgi:hypothetical protein
MEHAAGISKELARGKFSVYAARVQGALAAYDVGIKAYAVLYLRSDESIPRQ